MTNNVGLSLRAAVSAAAALQPIAVSDAVQRDVLAYVGGRLEQLLIDGGAQPEVVRAVLAERGDDPALAARSVEQLKVGLRSQGLGRRAMAERPGDWKEGPYLAWWLGVGRGLGCGGGPAGGGTVLVKVQGRTLASWSISGARGFPGPTRGVSHRGHRPKRAYLQIGLPGRKACPCTCLFNAE